MAGALQDHDRALIIGRRTFGKGLVQKQYPFEDGSVLRMTISRYYTPSGRFIQTPYESGDREDYYASKNELFESERTLSAEDILDQIPDSLKYETSTGRIVVGGGGIVPDYIIPRDTISSFAQVVLGNRLDREFASDWVAEHSAQVHDAWVGQRAWFLDEFTIDDATYRKFEAYLAERGVEIVDAATAPEASEAEETIYFTRDAANADREWMKNLLKAHIGVLMYDHAAWYPVRHSYDDALQEALGRWHRAEELLAVGN